RSVAPGAVAALWGQATALELAALIDAQVPRDRRGRLPTRAGLTPGQTLVLAAVARACRPLSKRAFAAWAQTTSLGRLAGVDVAKLTSQHLWDQMDTVPAPPVTLIYDKGNVSRTTQAAVTEAGLHYVSSLVPSQHPALLAEALPRLAPVRLPTGEEVPAYRTRQPLWGQERTLVVLRSERL